MAWTIKYSSQAKKQLAKLDRPVARRIHNFLRDRVAEHGNPRSLGKALVGDGLSEFWRYRVGDYRVIAKIEDQHIQVVVVRIGNRSDVYKNHG